jgi:hypothetical protein
MLLDRRKKPNAIQKLIASRLSSPMLITRLKKKFNFKMGVAAKVRGVVECKNVYEASLHLLLDGLVLHETSSDTTCECSTR